MGADLAMRISGSSNTRRIISGKKDSKPRAGKSEFSLQTTEDAAPAHQGGEIRAIGSVDALLALQGEGQPSGRRAKAIRRGRQMLDILDDVRVGLLTGQVREDRLRELSQLTGEETGTFEDPGLRDVLDSIDLRAQVELAKLKR